MRGPYQLLYLYVLRLQLPPSMNQEPPRVPIFGYITLIAAFSSAGPSIKELIGNFVWPRGFIVLKLP